MDPGLKSSNSNNRVARASAAARGVSFIFGRFFGRKLENPVFCVVFANNTMVRCFRFPLFFSWFLPALFFLVRFLRKRRKYHVFRLCCLLIFRVSCEVFVWKASKTRGFCMLDVSKVMQQEAATRASQSNRQRSRSNATKETEDTSRIRMDVITPPPFPPSPRPHRAERQM